MSPRGRDRTRTHLISDDTFLLHQLELPDAAQRKLFLRHQPASRLAAWASAGASSVVLSWLRDGMRLPWLHGPPQPFHQGVSLRGLTPQQTDYLRPELQRLFNTGALEPATSDRYVTRCFLVPKPGQPNKWRLVIDLRYVNLHLRKQSTRMETLKSLRHLAQSEDYLFSIDLQDGFNCVPVHPDDRKFLTVHVEGFGLMQFAALPFGLTSSPYAFCKVMRTFVQALRAPLAVSATALPPAATSSRAPQVAPTAPHVTSSLASPQVTPPLSSTATAARTPPAPPASTTAQAPPLAAPMSPPATSMLTTPQATSATAGRTPPAPRASYVPPHRRAAATQPPCPPSSTPAAPSHTPPRVLSDLLPRFRSLMLKGLRVLPYMDDFLFLCRSRADALEAREYVSAVLELLGLQRQPSKGQWDPVQCLQHLGLGVDTVRGQFFVSPERLARLHDFAGDLLGRAARSQGLVPKRQLAAFAGLAQSMYLALPPARLFLRSTHDCISSSPGWNTQVRLSSSCRTDLQWFKDLPSRWNGRDIWRSPHTATLHCDASKLAWGGVLNMSSPARGFWKSHQQTEHITLLELRSVFYTCQTFRKELRGKTVQLWEDNQAVVAILKSWTTKSADMMRVLRKLWLLLDINNITLRAQYIASADNVWADALSRQDDTGDWRLNPSVFRQLERRWGPHSVDRFATSLNTQLPRFNSAWGDPQAEAVDAFAQPNWGSENNYCNPPWSELDRLAQLLRETGAAATVVAPHWPAQAWFQQLQALSSDSCQFLPQIDLFCPGRLGSSAPIGPPSWPVTCFRIPARR